jgi:hypothetical protein
VDSGCLPRPGEPSCEWCGDWEHDKGTRRCLSCSKFATPREALADLIDTLRFGAECNYTADTYGWERWSKMADAMVHAAARDAREAERKRCEGVAEDANRTARAALAANLDRLDAEEVADLYGRAAEAKAIASAIAALAGRAE